MEEDWGGLCPGMGRLLDVICVNILHSPGGEDITTIGPCILGVTAELW